MLYYPEDPDKSFVKRVIAEEGDRCGASTASVYRNDVLIDDEFVPRSTVATTLGPGRSSPRATTS